MSSQILFQPTETDGGMIVPVRRCRSDKVAVAQTAHGLHLVAVRPIVAGDPIFRIHGRAVNRPSRHSVQIGKELHVDVGEGVAREEVLSRYFWRFMNHACEPNAQVRGRDVVALRDIRPWESVTYNYNTTEYELSGPFACQCGSRRCLGEIRGFRHLSVSERERLGALAASHLQELSELGPAR